MTPEEVAKWLYKKLMRDGEMTNRQAVHYVRAQFGEDWLVTNEFGNPALHPDVLKLFRRYMQGKAEWNRDDTRWKRTVARPVDDDE